MLRGIQSIAALIVVSALAGCSSGPGQDPARANVQAESTAVQCRPGGGPRTVTLLSFDATSLELTGFADDGSYVDVLLTSATTAVAADLRLFPPDPIFPQCKDDATAWNRAVGDGLTRTVLADLGQLAFDDCNVSVSLALDGTVSTLQPVP
jgi:hypothetical protein